MSKEADVGYSPVFVGSGYHSVGPVLDPRPLAECHDGQDILTEKTPDSEPLPGSRTRQIRHTGR